MKKQEPERLARGKAIHKKIQAEWVDEAEGNISVEHGITKSSG